MREREVVRVIAERLRSEGISDLKVRYASQRGADIEGTLPRSRRRLLIEAKGVRSGGGERSALGEALLQILSLYDRDVVCAIGTPYTRKFENFLRSIIPGLAYLGIHLLLVRDDEIWHVDPKKKGFFPERVESLVARFDL